MKTKMKLPYDKNKTIWYECERIDKNFAVKSYDDYATGDRIKKIENIRSYAVKGKQILDNVIRGMI